jgi:hypothetical protein
MPAQAPRQLFVARTRQGGTRHGQDDDILGAHQERHRQGDAAGRIRRAVPGDRNALAERGRRPRRRDQNWRAALEKDSLQCRFARRSRSWAGPADGDDIKCRSFYFI